ncbi:MAG: thermosome subunit alpha [Haloferacaceae archaeon]
MSEAGDQQRPLGAGQPVFVLSDDVERTQGEDAQSANITAGKAVAESVRTTLGPNGMDKMLVSDGDVVVTNDGATILDEMDIEHPAADMIVEVAQAQDEEVGDGTTTAAVLTGELLAEAEDLLETDVHPTTIVEGYARAADIAVETVDESVVSDDLDDEVLQQVAVSSMTGKGTGGATADQLAAAIVDAVRRGQSEDGSVDADAVQVVAQSGRSSTATEIVEGVVLDDVPEREDTSRRFEDATVAVVNQSLEQRETEIDVEYNIDTADQFADAVASEKAALQEFVDTFVAHDVDVVFGTSDVADELEVMLANEDIAVYEHVSDDDAAAVAKATGARLIGQIEDIDAADLGTAESVAVETFDDEALTFVEGGAASTTMTLFVRGGTGHVIEELERAVSDGVDSVVSALTGGGVVPGAGAVEIAMANAVRDEAASIEGRQQLAVEAFADAVEALPRTLAQNAGRDPIDSLVELRAANESGRAGIIGSGGDAEVVDPVERGVLDPAAVKREATRSATEAATMIARIDDVISAQ